MKYIRLTRKKRSFVGFTQLWLAPDHILLVRSTRFTEYYQRFALSDIQSIVVTQLPDQLVFQILLVAGIIGGALAFFSVATLFAKILFGSGAAYCLLVLLFNTLAGPRCRCVLQTAITTEPLKPVARVRTARAVLQQIRPLIESIQGPLTTEHATAVDLPRDPVIKPPEIARAPGYLPETLFILFLVNAALVVASVRYPRAQLAGILFTTIFGEIIIIVFALLRRAGRDPRRIIYGVMIGAIFCIAWDAYHLIASFGGWMNGIVEAARRGEQSRPPSLANWIAFTYASAAFAAIWRMIAGALGLVTGYFER